MSKDREKQDDIMIDSKLFSNNEHLDSRKIRVLMGDLPPQNSLPFLILSPQAISYVPFADP